MHPGTQWDPESQMGPIELHQAAPDQGRRLAVQLPQRQGYRHVERIRLVLSLGNVHRSCGCI